MVLIYEPELGLKDQHPSSKDRSSEAVHIQRPAVVGSIRRRQYHLAAVDKSW